MAVVRVGVVTFSLVGSLLASLVASPVAAQDVECRGCDVATDAARDSAEARSERRMEDQLRRVAERMRMQMQVSRVRIPGWVGINFSGGELRQTARGDVELWHEEYPVVVAVEPGSPAEAAGLLAGDVITAYNGQDVRRRAIPVAKVLRPGARVVVTVRRDGASRDIPIRVARRPRAMMQGLVGPELPPLPEMRGGLEPPSMIAPRERAHETVARAPRPDAPMMPSEPQAFPMPEPLITVFTPSSMVIAGAQVVTVNTDLGDVLDIRRGVLVTNIPPGTPAAEAGLRCGDVIVTADRQPVTSPMALQRILQRGTERGDRITLQVMRKNVKRTVVLRW